VSTVTLDHAHAKRLNLSPGVYALRRVSLFAASNSPELFTQAQLQELVIIHTIDFPLTSPCATIITDVDVWYLLEHATSDLEHLTDFQSYKVSQSYSGETASVLRLPDDIRMRWAYQLIAQLHLMHYAGYTHNDIKANNVLVFPDNTVQLADFGFVNSLWTSSTSIGGTVTLPEMASGAGLSAHVDSRKIPPSLLRRRDVFALGIVLAYLFGAHPSMWRYLRIASDTKDKNGYLFGQYLRLMGVTQATLADCLAKGSFEQDMKTYLRDNPSAIQTYSGMPPIVQATVQELLQQANAPRSSRTSS
jgi:serine/threonine protein kinase